MPVRLTSVISAISLSCALGAAAALSAPGAHAQSPTKQCGDQWKTAKAAGTVPAGQKRADFIKECRDRLAGQPGGAAPATPTAAAPANPLRPAATAPAAAPAATPAAPAASSAAGAKPATAGQTAERTRMKQCGAEWRANKAQLQAQTPGLKWPKYWSECNTRLKAAGQ